MHGITLVYTGAGRSADAAIERLAYLAAPQGVTVATSDLLQRRLVGGKGQATISARELEQEVRAALRATERQSASGRQLSALARRVEDQLDSETRAKLERLRRGLPLDPPTSD
jgi:predicted RNA-binding protein with PIN domain